MQWQQGTGKYIDTAHTTYVVVGEQGAFWTLMPGTKIGHGNTVRRITYRGNMLVAVADRPGDSFEDLVFEDNMEGFWDTSGKEVFTTDPHRTNARVKAKERRGTLRQEEPAMLDEGVEEPEQEQEPEIPQLLHDAPELTPRAQQVLAEIFAVYQVYRGSRGVVVLKDADGAFYTPDDIRKTFAGLLGTDQRGPVLRAIIRHEGVSPLTEVPLVRYPDSAYSCIEEGEWVLHRPSVTPQRICSTRDGVPVAVAGNPQAWRMSVNPVRGKWKNVVGVLSSPDYVAPNPRGRHELIVACPRGAMRTVTLLIATDNQFSNQKYVVAQFRLERDLRGQVALSTMGRDQHVPPYVLGVDNKGVPRVFERP